MSRSVGLEDLQSIVCKLFFPSSGGSRRRVEDEEDFSVADWKLARAAVKYARRCETCSETRTALCDAMSYFCGHFCW